MNDPVSQPVKARVTYVDEDRVFMGGGLDGNPNFVLYIWLATARLGEWVEHYKTSPKTRKMIYTYCEKVGWDMITPVHIQFPYKRGDIRVLNKWKKTVNPPMLNAIHWNLNKEGVLDLPHSSYQLPTLCFSRGLCDLRDQSEVHRTESKKNKQTHKHETDLERRCRLNQEAMDQYEEYDTEYKAILNARPFWVYISRRIDTRSLVDFLCGDVVSNCIFIRDHNQRVKGKKYVIRTGVGSFDVPLHKFLRFYLNHGGIGEMTRNANKHCRKLESTNKKHLCINPFHYCNSATFPHLESAMVGEFKPTGAFDTVEEEEPVSKKPRYSNPAWN